MNILKKLNKKITLSLILFFTFFSLTSVSALDNLIDKNNNSIVLDSIGFDISNLVEGETYTFTSNLPVYWFKISDDRYGYDSFGCEDNLGFTTITFTMTRHSNISPTAKQYLFIGIKTPVDYTLPNNISAYANYDFSIVPYYEPISVTSIGMYSFLSITQISDFLLNFDINFITLTSFEQAVVIFLANIFWLMFIIFVVSFVYKFMCRIARFIF